MESKLVLSPQELMGFMSGGAMNHQYGIQVYFEVDSEKAQALLPPPLKVVPESVGYVYIVNIREPSFGPWYMEGGVGIMAEAFGVRGLHFFGLQLSGPGALMGMCSGREGSGLPKKLADRIHVERLGDTGHCFIERDGVRLVDVELKMGQYNDPTAMAQFTAAQEGCTREKPLVSDGSCLLFRYALDNSIGFKDMRMTYYDSPTRFYQWDPATVKMTLASGPNDAWGEIPMKRVLGGGWMVSDNWVRSQRVVHEYTDEQAGGLMLYLFDGRYDRCILTHEHQVYE